MGVYEYYGFLFMCYTIHETRNVNDDVLPCWKCTVCLLKSMVPGKD